MTQKSLSTRDELTVDMRQINTGGLSFAEIRSRDKLYVDKTGLIKDILEKDDSGVYLFTRPRRFGKSTNLSMLDAFFNIKYKGNTWFDGLEISRYPEYGKYKSAFPVIYLDLKDTTASTYNSFVRKMRTALRKLFTKYRYLLDSDCMYDDDRAIFEQVLSKTTEEDDIQDCIPFLCSKLEEYHNEKIVILIDEYDRALSDAFGTDDQKHMAEFLGNIISCALKSNESLQMACVTGVMQVAKAGMFSGANNIEVNNIFSEMSDERFGFTESEVKQILTEYGCLEKFDEAREWYDGYRFGNAEVYNPFSIMSYVSSGFDPEEYWGYTAVNTAITYLLEDLGDKDYSTILSVVSNGTAVVELYRKFDYKSIARTGKPLFSLMSMAGYLKAIPREDGKFEISIPNNEVQEIIDTMMREVYPISESAFNDFCKALLNEDVETLIEVLQDIMKDASYMHLDEYTYQAVVMTLMTGLRSIYDVKVEPESGNGRADIILRPKVEYRKCIIIEIKRAQNEESLDTEVEDAISQIHRKRYYLGMPGTVTLLGLAFWIKIPRARFENIDNGPKGTAMLNYDQNGETN